MIAKWWKRVVLLVHVHELFNYEGYYTGVERYFNTFYYNAYHKFNENFDSQSQNYNKVFELYWIICKTLKIKLY